MSTVIVTGVYNNTLAFKLFYYSLRKHTPKGRFSLVVVNDQSTDPDLLAFLEIIGHESDVTVVREKIFDGNIAADALLFDYAVQEAWINADYILFAHSDIEFLDEQWLDRVIAPIELYDQCIGSVLIDTGGQLGIVRNGWLPMEHERFERKEAFIYGPRIAPWFAFFDLPAFRQLGLHWKRDFSRKLFVDEVRTFDDVGTDILYYLCTNQDGFFVSVLEESPVYHWARMVANVKRVEMRHTSRFLVPEDLWSQQHEAKKIKIRERLAQLYSEFL